MARAGSLCSYLLPLPSGIVIIEAEEEEGAAAQPLGALIARTVKH